MIMVVTDSGFTSHNGWFMFTLQNVSFIHVDTVVAAENYVLSTVRRCGAELVPFSRDVTHDAARSSGVTDKTTITPRDERTTSPPCGDRTASLHAIVRVRCDRSSKFE